MNMTQKQRLDALAEKYSVDRDLVAALEEAIGDVVTADGGGGYALHSQHRVAIVEGVLTALSSYWLGIITKRDEEE